jgi:hypothetical protein
VKPTIKQRLEVFCDMALQLRRDASTDEERELVGEVLITMLSGGVGMSGNPGFWGKYLTDEEFAERLRVALHGTLGEKIAAAVAVHVVPFAQHGIDLASEPDYTITTTLTYPEMERMVREFDNGVLDLPRNTADEWALSGPGSLTFDSALPIFDVVRDDE